MRPSGGGIDVSRQPASGRRYLTVAQVRAVYDRIGRIQDLQGLYERRATNELIAHTDFESAQAVFELGYGTGAFARRLLERHLPPASRYVGVDVSPRMHELARRRLDRFADRAELRLGDGSLHFPFKDDAFDRVVANYVLDLLAPTDIGIFIEEARRLLAPGGLLCLASLTFGATRPARLVTRVWEWLWAYRPELVGGCRPLRLTDQLDRGAWSLRHHAVVTSFGVSSEIVVAAQHRHDANPTTTAVAESDPDGECFQLVRARSTSGCSCARRRSRRRRARAGGGQGAARASSGGKRSRIQSASSGRRR